MEFPEIIHPLREKNNKEHLIDIKRDLEEMKLDISAIKNDIQIIKIKLLARKKEEKKIVSHPAGWFW